MLLIEADGKALLAEHGIAVPDGVLVTDADDRRSPRWSLDREGTGACRWARQGRWYRAMRAPQDVAAAVHRMLGQRLKGHQVEACLIEQTATGQERYLAVMVDAASYGLRVIYSAQGGVDIEQSASAQSRLVPRILLLLRKC